MKAHFSPPLISLPLAMTLLGISLPLHTAMAQTQVAFEPPPMSSPGNRESGGGRSDTCASTTEEAGLTAIVPETNVGLTVRSAPTLFAYLPSNSAERAELRLYVEATGEQVLTGQIDMPLATEPDDSYTYRSGVVKVALPTEGIVTLEPGENYLWALMLVCNGGNRAEDIVVTGVVQRAGDDYLKNLPDNLGQKLANLNAVSDEEKLSIYSSAGIWQDLLTDLAILVEEEPMTYGDDWIALLESQGLAAIATAPVFESSFTPLSP